ncbi:MAG: methyltransferase domain-containing protein [Chromatiales bacterium]|nr:methyltransferase domain-containing protein [Chromatiales bacterium]
MRNLVIGLMLSLAAVTAARALDEQSVRPGVNRNYENPDFEAWAARFEQPQRELYARRADVLAASRVRPGMAVADIGAGTGLYTREFAAAVGPSGTVYAVDIARSFLDGIERLNRERGITNVRTVLNNPRSVELPEQSIDLAFVAATYHHFEYPQSTLASIRQALRPRGQLIVIDFRKAPGVSSPWVMQHVRGDQRQTVAEIEAAGFELVEDLLLLRENFFLRFRPRGK